MLTDATLREAAAEAERLRLSIVPEDGEPHLFSKRFERKMQKLIRRTNHPIRYQVMRIAAAVLLVIATLFGAVMTISPEVRAAVVGWIKETFGVYAHYSNDHVQGNDDTDSHNDTPKATKGEYHLAVVPEGYRELNVIDKADGRLCLYLNDSGHVLQFTYTYGVENSSLFIKTEDYMHYMGLVNKLSADIYIPLKESETSVIIWEDPHTGVLFEIFAMADLDELIKIAETVARIET